jgi:hypothetical protein
MSSQNEIALQVEALTIASTVHLWQNEESNSALTAFAHRYRDRKLSGRTKRMVCGKKPNFRSPDKITFMV